MKKSKVIAVCVLIAGVVAGVFFLQKKTPATESTLSSYEYVYGAVNDVAIKLYVADTVEKRVQGLSGVTNLQEDEGMLFVFPDNDTHGIWMKDMYIDLDIIWLNEDAKVVHVERNVSKDTYPKVFESKVRARYVIELHEEVTTKHKIEVGNAFKFSSRKN